MSHINKQYREHAIFAWVGIDGKIGGHVTASCDDESALKRLHADEAKKYLCNVMLPTVSDEDIQLMMIAEDLKTEAEAKKGK